MNIVFGSDEASKLVVEARQRELRGEELDKLEDQISFRKELIEANRDEIFILKGEIEKLEEKRRKLLNPQPAPMPLFDNGEPALEEPGE